MATKGIKLTKQHKLLLSTAMKGKFEENNGAWKGGKHKDTRGYMRILVTRNGERKYYLEHRIIMEKHLGRTLEPYETVHHINGIKDDNRIKNLQLMIGFFHKAKIRCPHCLKTFMVQ